MKAVLSRVGSIGRVSQPASQSASCSDFTSHAIFLHTDVCGLDRHFDTEYTGLYVYVRVCEQKNYGWMECLH